MTNDKHEIKAKDFCNCDHAKTLVKALREIEKLSQGDDFNTIDALDIAICAVKSHEKAQYEYQKDLDTHNQD